MKQVIKNILMKLSFVVNYFPLNNLITNRGVSIDIKDALLFGCKVKCKGKNNKIIVKKGSVLKKCCFTFYGDNNTIVIGENVTGIGVIFHFEDSKNSISIGNDTKICGRTELAAIENTSISIGDSCLFSSGISFRTGDSHSVIDLYCKRLNPSKNITIGKHVWIGQSVTVTKGVIIPDNCVVGIGAIVTKQFSETNIAIAGNPAKIIKQEINWDVKRL